MPDIKTTLYKVHKSIAFTVPVDIVRKLNMHANQKMAFYFNDEIIFASVLKEKHAEPPYQYWTNTLNIGNTTIRVIIPAPVIKKFKLAIGDNLLIKTGKIDDVQIIALKPDRPKIQMRTQEKADGKTIVNVQQVNADGTVDKDSPIIKGEMSAADAEKMHESMDAGDKTLVDNYIEEFESVNMVVPKDYKPEVFLTRDVIKEREESKISQG